MSNEFINIGSANSSPEHFQLRYISISKYEGDWQSLPHTHHFSELFYVLRGEGAFYIENEKVPVKTDDLVIINPYVECAVHSVIDAHGENPSQRSHGIYRIRRGRARIFLFRCRAGQPEGLQLLQLRT